MSTMIPLPSLFSFSQVPVLFSYIFLPLLVIFFPPLFLNPLPPSLSLCSLALFLLSVL